MRRCGDCQWWNDRNVIAGEAACKCMPPIRGEYAVTSYNDWCGQFHQREPQPLKTEEPEEC